MTFIHRFCQFALKFNMATGDAVKKWSENRSKTGCVEVSPFREHRECPGPPRIVSPLLKDASPDVPALALGGTQQLSHFADVHFLCAGMENLKVAVEDRSPSHTREQLLTPNYLSDVLHFKRIPRCCEKSKHMFGRQTFLLLILLLREPFHRNPPL